MENTSKQQIMEDVLKSKEIAKQYSKNLALQQLASNEQLDSSQQQTSNDKASELTQLESMMADSRSNKSNFNQYLKKNQHILDEHLLDLLNNKGKISTDSLLNNINMTDIIPTLSEQPAIFDASQEIAMATMNQDYGILNFYNNLKKQINSYQQEVKLHQENEGEDFCFDDESDNAIDIEDLMTDQNDEVDYNLDRFIDFKDILVKHLQDNNGSNSSDLKESFLNNLTDSLQNNMQNLVETSVSLSDNNPMLTTSSTSNSVGSQQLAQSSSSNGDDMFEYLIHICPRGIMSAVVLAFFVAQQAMQENIKGPASDVYSSSATVNHLSKWANAMGAVNNKDDNGNPIKIYERDKDGSGWVEVKDPTPEQSAYWILANAKQAQVPPSKAGATTSKAASSLINFIKQTAKSFGSNLDDDLSIFPSDMSKYNPDSSELKNASKVLGDAYNKLMGTKSNCGSDGIIAKWVEHNDSKHSADIIQLLNDDRVYKFYSTSPEEAFSAVNSAKDGINSGLTSATSALNLAQTQTNALNTAFYGWMKSWSDNAVEIARKTG